MEKSKGYSVVLWPDDEGFRLNADQLNRFHFTAAPWTRRARDTAPADHPSAEKGANRLYRALGYEAPHVVWCASPVSMAIAAALVAKATAVNAPRPATGAKHPFRRIFQRDFYYLGFDMGLPYHLFSRERSEVSRYLQSQLSHPPVNLDKWLGLAAAHWIEALRQNTDDEITPLPQETIDQAVHDAVRPFTGLAGDELLQAFETNRHFRGQVLFDAQQILRTQPVFDRTQCAHYEFLKSEFERTEERAAPVPRPDPGGKTDFFEGLCGLAAEAGLWIAQPNIVWVCERPSQVRLSPAGFFHHTDGPAAEFTDGVAFYAYNGTRVPGGLIEHRDAITREAIDREWNVETRRLLIELFGAERYLKASGAELIDEAGEDADLPLGLKGAKLWRTPVRFAAQEPVVMVELTNTTPEKDGTRKTYFLRVPPQSQTVLDAVASTFGLEPGQYNPRLES